MWKIDFKTNKIHGSMKFITKKEVDEFITRIREYDPEFEDYEFKVYRYKFLQGWKRYHA
jgi:hypothetical protein